MRPEDDPTLSPLFARPDVRPYLREPDYSRPLFELPAESARTLKEKLRVLYGDRTGACYSELERIMQVHHAYKTPEILEAEQTFQPQDLFSERDIVGITYADQVRKRGTPPLVFLSEILRIFLHGVINTVHILPFYPYSSDRGFSVIDYQAVDPRLGGWEDIESLHRGFKLMFDGVINHVSAKSEWFEQFLNGNSYYQDFFTHFETKHAISEDHLRLILRPRTSDLLTPFETIRGRRYVWTTFSPDQVDLNYRNERVLFRMMEVLLFYVRKGADLIRLDAATYLWWELGTSSAHLLGTHTLVQLIRAVFDLVAPGVILVTETNVPHQDNVGYFGDGTNEAHMVYNFSLPPLVLHAFQVGDCTELSQWAAGLESPSELCTYFNILDTHDGIGLLGARDILSEDQVRAMVERTEAYGGLISYRTDRDGTRSPYELNITWYDAINPQNGPDTDEIKVKRFLASRAVALALAGVAGIYLPSLTGSQLTRRVRLAELDEPRSINRQMADPKAFEKLTDRGSVPYRIAQGFRTLAEARAACPAFHPNGSQRVVTDGDGVFKLFRQSPDKGRTVLTLTNVTGETQEVRLGRDAIGIRVREWRNLLDGRSLPARGGGVECRLAAYEVMWLEVR